MTFAQATKDHLQNLKAMGWTVADGLKVPHAGQRDPIVVQAPSRLGVL
jgi:hypothetical protein